MKIGFATENFSKLKTEAIVIFVSENNQKFTPDLTKLDNMLGQTITLITKKKYFSGKNNEIHSIYTHGKLIADKILLVGIGKKEKFEIEVLRSALATALRYLKSISIKKATVILPQENLSMIYEMAVISQISLYGFHQYKTRDKQANHQIKEIDFYLHHKKSKNELNQVLNRAEIVAEAVNWTRNMINHPSNYLTPKSFARHLEDLKNRRIRITISGRKKIKNLGMGLLSGVAKGSDEEPQFITLEYLPKKYRDTIVLVGKGLTFDSGGISLKNSEKMDEMKMDMAGAASVAGAIKAISKLNPKVRVIGLLPTTENLPSGSALKPGDILTSLAGLTVEVINTDAEGRMVLADALQYSHRFKPTVIIDLATLTGACVSALGHEAAALIGNDLTIIKKVEKSAEVTGERVWQMPLWNVYREKIKSEIADIKNSSDGKGAGVMMGAAFLENFVGKYPWVHLDIAGTAFNDDSKPYNPKGGTGYGVRLLVDLIENWDS